MVILGIDPGSVRAGYGIIAKNGGRLRYLESGLLKIPPGAEPGKQLLALEKDLENIIKRVKPRTVGVEKIFMSRNKKTAIFVAQARGLIMKVIASRDLKLIELSPPSIKAAVTGNGRADKKSVAKMVGLFLNVKTTGMVDDESDALAVAIAVSTRPIPD